MKKFLLLVSLVMLTFALAACSECPECETLADIPTEVTMAEVDDYLGRPDVQYVDLRNFDDKMNSGYIQGFEMIPFFDYMEAEGILTRTDGWNFETVANEVALKALFNEDKTIFLMCGSGTRAGFVKAALESLGYENVINVGGIKDYAGDNKVAGDGTFKLYMPGELDALPEVVDMSNIDSYLGRPDVQYVDLRNFDDKMNSGYISGFEMIPFFDYMEAEDILVRTDGNWEYAAEDTVNLAALQGLFDADKTIFLMCGSGTRAGYVKAALEAAGYTDVVNVGGIGTYAGDNKVFGDGTFKLFTTGEIATGSFTPGVYYGYEAGYVAVVTVGEGGAITNVFLDAPHFVYGTSEFISMKKAYNGIDEYSMNATCDELTGECTLNEGKLSWFDQVAALEDAIVDAQAWSWTVDENGDIDAVAGVTISVANWQIAVEEAIAAATPSE